MPVIVDLYTHRKSWLHKTDPRVKLFFVATALILLLVIKNIYMMVSIVIFVHLLHVSAKMPMDKFKFIWKTLIPISIMISVLWMVFYPEGEVLFQIWIVKVTLLGFVQGAVLALRIMSMAFVVFSWLFTTEQPDLVRSLVKLKMPFEWGLILTLALRYIPTFQGMYGTISEAQQARGLDTSEEKGFERVKAMMPIFIAMFISSLRASDQLAKAMDARAFGIKGATRTTLHDINFDTIDYFYILIIILLFVSVLYLNLVYGFASQPIMLFP
jgi:energy-coupling factor transport system permease protein